MRGALLLWLLVLLQCLCAAVFLWDILASILGARTAPISWQLREFLEIAASLGLIIGAVLGLRAVATARRDKARAETALRSASGAFATVVEEQFAQWGLTPAERDVAWLSIKGLSIAEIAGLRGTSEGTIKAQSNAIYRKAGVTGRGQLLAGFVEDLLLEGPQIPVQAVDAASTTQAAHRG